ncbi:hypothetical protein [Pyruvatibacter mobilis]|uniref:hypothetical protein n=1 Tax=Pyruvatibacter mobilis TaxID=1712261 RepID=UPI003BAE7CDA
MTKKRIAEYIAEALIEDGTTCVCWGDGILVDVARPHLKGHAASHPLNVMTAACNALERAPDLFEKRKMYGMDCRGRARLVRMFMLKQPHTVAGGE